MTVLQTLANKKLNVFYKMPFLITKKNQLDMDWKYLMVSIKPT